MPQLCIVCVPHPLHLHLPCCVVLCVQGKNGVTVNGTLHTPTTGPCNLASQVCLCVCINVCVHTAMSVQCSGATQCSQKDAGLCLSQSRLVVCADCSLLLLVLLLLPVVMLRCVCTGLVASR